MKLVYFLFLAIVAQCDQHKPRQPNRGTEERYKKLHHGLDGPMVSLQQELNHMHQQLAMFSRQMSNLQKSVQELEAKVEYLYKQAPPMDSHEDGKARNFSSEINVEQHQPEKRTPGNNLAFAAVNTEADLFPVAADIVMTYPSVIMTEGGGYDENTSEYTCPVTGLYFITASVMSANFRLCIPDEGPDDCYIFQDAHFSITLDGTRQVSMRVWDVWRGTSNVDEDNMQENTASVSVVVNCAADSKIKVVAEANSIIKCPTNVCSFTGFLISQTE